MQGLPHDEAGVRSIPLGSRRRRFHPWLSAVGLPLVVFLLAGGWFVSQRRLGLPEDHPVRVPYVFPVRPGMPEWAAYQNPSAQFQVCQIPLSLARRMTTEALLETCLSHPIASMMWFLHGSDDAHEMLMKGFNGYRELLYRVNFGDVLTRRLEQSWEAMRVNGTRIPLADVAALSRLGLHYDGFDGMSPRAMERLLEVSLRMVNGINRFDGCCFSECLLVGFSAYLVCDKHVRITKGGVAVDSEGLERALKAGYQQPNYDSGAVNGAIVRTLGDPDLR